jgi:ABC-type Zn uptake system ZnuABC Zn-binding protein ZnuA
VVSDEQEEKRLREMKRNRRQKTSKKKGELGAIMKTGKNTLRRFFGLAVAATAAVLLLLGGMARVAPAAGKINIVTATTDLAALTEEVGGDRVTVTSVARGYQDPHFVEAKPSFLLQLRKADLLIVVGLQLEIGWLPPLITQSGNPKIQLAAPGYLDASQFAEILEIPTGQITRAMGDVHPLGNPHYWLDPQNGLRIAQGIEQKLSVMSPGDAAYFAERLKSFQARLAEAEKRWDEEMKPYRGRKVVTYHRSWPNFAKRFGLDVVGYVEPRPGIPPSPGHTVELIQQMKRENVKVILVEPYFDLKTPNSVGRETGAQVLTLLPSVGGEKEVTDYFKLFDYDLALLTKAFQQAR